MPIAKSNEGGLSRDILKDLFDHALVFSLTATLFVWIIINQNGLSSIIASDFINLFFVISYVLAFESAVVMIDVFLMKDKGMFNIYSYIEYNLKSERPVNEECPVTFARVILPTVMFMTIMVSMMYFTYSTMIYHDSNATTHMNDSLNIIEKCADQDRACYQDRVTEKIRTWPLKSDRYVAQAKVLGLFTDTESNIESDILRHNLARKDPVSNHYTTKWITQAPIDWAHTSDDIVINSKILKFIKQTQLTEVLHRIESKHEELDSVAVISHKIAKKVVQFSSTASELRPDAGTNSISSLIKNSNTNDDELSLLIRIFIDKGLWIPLPKDTIKKLTAIDRNNNSDICLAYKQKSSSQDQLMDGYKDTISYLVCGNETKCIERLIKAVNGVDGDLC